MNWKNVFVSSALAFSLGTVAFTTVAPSVLAKGEQGNNIVENFNGETVDEFVLTGGALLNGVVTLDKADGITTKDEFRYFQTYISASVDGGMQISFGDCKVLYDSTAGISFDGASLILQNERTLQGEILFRISVLGNLIEVGAKLPNEPQEYLFENIATAMIDGDYTFSSLQITAVGENAKVYLDYIEIFSLEQSIETEREDYDPSHEIPAFEEKPDKGEDSSCSSEVGGLTFVVVGVVGLLLLKKKGGK